MGNCLGHIETSDEKPRVYYHSVASDHGFQPADGLIKAIKNDILFVNDVFSAKNRITL